MNTEARKTTDDILSTLEKRLATPGHPLPPVLSVMGRFSKYSLSNQLLILAQRPDATRVMGFQAWRHSGYQVRKGDKGIMIYAPTTFRDDDAASDEPPRRVGFRVTYVFDIAQVDAHDEALPMESAVSAAPLRALEQLKAFLVGHNLELAYASLGAGCYGWTNGRRITCANNLAPADRSQRPDLRETEAEVVAWLLSTQPDLTGTDASIDYIKGYRGTPETLELLLECIRTTAARLAFEPAAVSFEPPEIPA